MISCPIEFVCKFVIGFVLPVFTQPIYYVYVNLDEEKHEFYLELFVCSSIDAGYTGILSAVVVE